MAYNKFNAKKTWLGGHQFDSKKEAGRYVQLKLMESAGEITDLELQPRFLLQEKFTRRGKTYRKIEYVADFRYRDKDGNVIVEDAKGHKTDVYQLKKKLLLARYDIDFREI